MSVSGTKRVLHQSEAHVYVSSPFCAGVGDSVGGADGTKSHAQCAQSIQTLSGNLDPNHNKFSDDVQ